jgi:cathepsin X
MRVAISLLILVLTISYTYQKGFRGGGLLGFNKAPEGTPVRSHIAADLPKELNWRNHNGKNYVTRMRNQHIPQYCGSCWAQSTTSMIADRISIMREAAFPEIVLSAQILLDYDYNDSGCHGGDFSSALQWVKSNHLTEDNCSNYRAKGHEEENPDLQPYCKDCADGKCFVPKKYNKYTITEWGKIANNMDAIKTELLNGPISCSINASPMEDIPFGNRDVFTKNVEGGSNHAIGIVGWGFDEKLQESYWIMRNSWGEYFADEGYIKILAGHNIINIEDDCYYAIPKNTWDEQKHVSTKHETSTWDRIKLLEKSILNVTESLTPPSELAKKVARSGKFKGSYRPSTAVKRSHITSPNMFMQTNVPDRWSWADVNGTNFVSLTVNQHIPTYCGSCWAQAAVGALSDRINIMKNNYPRTFLSAQVLIDCGIGSCEMGGDALDAYHFAHEHGLPEYGCRNYIAKTEEQNCTAIQRCSNCPFFGGGDCFAVDHYQNWKVDQYGEVNGVDAMKSEIFNRGPIACGINATDDLFYNYDGSYIYESTDDGEINHQITVIGYGKDDSTGVSYWIIRNSWGSYWGANGYLKLKMGSNNLRIEESCRWATPKPEVL